MLASIEEKIEVLKTRKRDLAAVSFNPDGSALDLTGVDIDDLFALLLAELVVANLIARAMFDLGRVKKFAYSF
jgi:roadblock/LC7 domain-containing protein